jgi:outer membrane protein TolC
MTKAGWVLILFVCGCAQYRAKPLTSEGVEKGLAARDPQALRVEASSFKHPILKPVEVDLQRGLSPDEAAILAVIVNPSLRAERDQRAISAAQLLGAGILPNPTLTAGLDFPYDSSPPDVFTAYNVGLEWEITSLITRDAKVRAARATGASVDLDIAWKEWQTAEAAKVAAYDVIALEAQLVAARQADERQAQNLALVRKAVDAHQKTILDLSAAEAAAQDAHAALLSQQHDLAHQRLAMNRAIGVLPDSPISLRVGAQLPSHLDPPEMIALLDGLEGRRLDLLALKRGYESEDETLRAAILAQFPKIGLGFNGARDTSDVKTLGFGVSIDIPLFDRNQATIATEKATRQKLFDEYTARVFDARWDIATAIDDIRATNIQIADAEAALPTLQKFADTYRDALEKGNTDALSYYLAQTALANKQLAVIKLRQQLMENWIALEIASGQYLPISNTPTTREGGQ